MTQPVTEKKRPPLKWIVPIPTNEGGSFGRPSLCAACRGNDVMAVILNYFVYEASTEAEQKKIDTLKVQSIQLKRTHDEILKGIHPSRISKKTLIDHMHKLETWGFLKVDGYHHIYEVFFPAITEAMKTPPPAEKRKPRGRHVSQKVKSTNLQSSEVKSTNHAVKTTNSEDCTLEQISNLQSEMLNLQSEMSKLQFQMLNLTFRQSSEAASQQMLTPLSEAPRLIDCNRLIETSNYVAANAGNDTPSFSFPILDASSEAVTDETFKVAVMDDWREYKHLPRITPTIDVMSEVLKHLQRASVTPDFSTQANAVENPGQLADSSTVSQARDNGVREALDPLSTSEHVNTPHGVESSLSASTDTPPKASDHIAALATRNLDEDHATLSRSGESATTGDRETPTESSALETGKKPNKPRTPRVTTPKPEKPTPPPIVLNAEEQAFYDLYCSMPMIKIKPDVTAKVKEQCGKLAPHLKTQKQLFSLKTFMGKKDFFKGKGFALGMLVHALNDWAQEQEPIDLQKERNGASKDTAVRAGSTIMTPDPEKEAKLRAAEAALARLKEQEKAAQQYPGMRVAG